ncbi:MAG: MFS transporter [Planctomycetes bacterium]|nr:MFS transporter [Planctomycetota bacterium]
MQPSETPTANPMRVRWIILVLLCLSSGLLYLHRYSWGFVRPDIARENPELTPVDLGWLDSAFLATYALGQIPGGMAGDRFGPRIVLTVLTVVGTLAAVGVAWTGGFWQLFGARAAFGFAQAGVYPVLSKMTKSWFPLASRTSVQGAVTAMGRLGAAFAPIIIAFLLVGTLGLSWRGTLWVLTIPGILLAVGFWIAVRDTPSEHPWANVAEAELVRDAQPTPTESGGVDPRGSEYLTPGLPVSSTEAKGDPDPRGASDLTPGLLGAWFSLAMLFVYTFVSTFQDQFFVNLMPTFLEEAKGLSKQELGLYGALPLVGGAIGAILGGILNDWLIESLGSRRWARSLVAFTGKLLAGALVLCSMQVDDGRWALGVLMGVRIFSDWSLPTQWAAVTDMGGKAGATMFGIVNTVGVAGGFVAGPAFGWLKQHYGWDGVLLSVAIMCLLAACTWLFIDCTRRISND